MSEGQRCCFTLTGLILCSSWSSVGRGPEMSNLLFKRLFCNGNSICTTLDYRLHLSTHSCLSAAA